MIIERVSDDPVKIASGNTRVGRVYEDMSGAIIMPICRPGYSPNCLPEVDDRFYFVHLDSGVVGHVPRSLKKTYTPIAGSFVEIIQ